MRSNQKRKAFDETEINIPLNKRTKMQESKYLPIPEYLKCHPKKVEYFFYSVSERELFQKDIEQKINEKVKTDALIAELNIKQFNRWVEMNNGFDELMQIKEWMDNHVWYKLIARLNMYTPHFINQIALLKSDECLFEVLITSLSHQFSAFYSKVMHSPILFNHLMERNLFHDWNALMLTARHHPNEVSHLLDNMNDNTYERIVFHKNAYAQTFFQILIEYGNEYSISHFLKRLKPEVRLQLLLFHEVPDTFKQLCAYPSELFFWINSLFEHPEALKKICENQSMLNYLRIFDGGDSIDHWSKITKYVLDSTPPVRKHSTKLQLSNYLYEMKLPEHYNTMKLNEVNKYQFLRMQGRTLLFEMETKKIVALKIQKKNEKIAELIKEYRTAGYLFDHAEKYGLKSQYPEPKNIIILTDLKKWISSNITNQKQKKDLYEMIGDKNRYAAYEYHVDNSKNNYFTYLHDISISNDEFHRVNRIVIHDLFTLFKHGVIFSQLADIFHNLEHVTDRADKGRYIVLVNLLRNFYKKGSGRLTNWMQSVAYPNVRATGLADLGDRVSIDDLIGETERVKEYYSETWGMYKNKTCNYLLANVMAEYLYVLFLVAGRRGVDLTAEARSKNLSSVYISQIWQNLANQMLDNAILAISIMTHFPEKQIKTHLSSAVNTQKLAKQMQYWMTNEYISDIKKNIVREDIYDSDTEIEVEFKKLRKGTFNDTYGCSIDGKNPDLGPVNGQEPIKEQNKLIYWSIMYIFVFYNNFRLTLEDLHQIINEKNIKESEKIRSDSFRHLPKKNYHHIQGLICGERVLQKTLTPELKTEFENKAMHHKKEHAALVIQNFWKNYKIKKPEVFLEYKQKMNK